MYRYLKNLIAISLIEIIITITIIFILGTISVYSFQDYKTKANINGALATAEQNKLAINSFYAKNKTCPHNNFVNQQLKNVNCPPGSPTPCVASIANLGCTLNLNNGDNETILSFVAKLSNLGDFQYFCVLPVANPMPRKYLSFDCDGVPRGYLDP